MALGGQALNRAGATGRNETRRAMDDRAISRVRIDVSAGGQVANTTSDKYRTSASASAEAD